MPDKQRSQPSCHFRNYWSKQFDNQFQSQDTRRHADSDYEIKEIVKRVKGFRNKSEYLSQICFNVCHSLFLSHCKYNMVLSAEDEKFFVFAIKY